MAIIIKTRYANVLLKQLNEAIANRSIQTWQVDSEGDYTIVHAQWYCHAWFRPYVRDELIVFGIVQSLNFPMTRQLYGVFHGRFITTLLSHFDNMMDNVEISPLMDGDYDISEHV